jgi:1-phosphatidylinositol-4-phosphate 5-kinase
LLSIQSSGSRVLFLNQAVLGLTQDHGFYYIGELNSNRKQGVGREISIRNEYEYIGEFQDDYREGFGVVRDLEGIYHGNWVKGLRHGRGLLTMKNGSYYLGMWNLGKREGLGIFFKSSSNKIFKAEWLSD